MVEQGWPLVLLGLRLGVALALYLFLFTAIRALRAELRARTTPYAAPYTMPYAAYPAGAAVAGAVGTAAAPPFAERPAVFAPPSGALLPAYEAAPTGDRLEVVAGDAARAVAEAGALIGRSFALDGPTLVGRDLSNTIVIPERHVSARHARLVPADGGWWVEDLGSTNGTFIGGRRVSGRARLDPSSDLRFGPIALRLRQGG